VFWGVFFLKKFYENCLYITTVEVMYHKLSFFFLLCSLMAQNTSNALVHCDCLVKFALPQKALRINFYMGTKLFYNPIILGQNESPDLLHVYIPVNFLCSSCDEALLNMNHCQPFPLRKE
jgi:hypothetical protein